MLSEKKKRVLQTIDSIMSDGGKGSGNWGHKGRPGEVGGSGKGGGKSFRAGTSATGYSSFVKTEAFKSIRSSADSSKTYRTFAKSIDSTPGLKDAIEQQMKDCGTKETYDEYSSRIFWMLKGKDAPPKRVKPATSANWLMLADDKVRKQATSALKDAGGSVTAISTNLTKLKAAEEAAMKRAADAHYDALLNPLSSYLKLKGSASPAVPYATNPNLTAADVAEMKRLHDNFPDGSGGVDEGKLSLDDRKTYLSLLSKSMGGPYITPPAAATTAPTATSTSSTPLSRVRDLLDTGARSLDTVEKIEKELFDLPVGSKVSYKYAGFLWLLKRWLLAIGKCSIQNRPINVQGQ